jgi:hypothetical protein
MYAIARKVDEKRQLFLFTNHLQCSLATFVYTEVRCAGYAGCQGVGAVQGSALGRAPRHAGQTRPKRLAGVKLEKIQPTIFRLQGVPPVSAKEGSAGMCAELSPDFGTRRDGLGHRAL